MKDTALHHYPGLDRVAERPQVSPATVSRWVRRARDHQEREDRTRRPHRCSRQLCQRQERRIIALRFTHQWGPHRISARLGIPRSTVDRVLHRYLMPKLAWIDQATGLPVRHSAANRYEASAPGELIYVDIKKLGRIPDGGGWRAQGRGSAQDLAAVRSSKQQARTGAPASRDYRFLHHAVDDHSRVAYSEILDDERKHTAAGFWQRAGAFFAGIGVQVSAVMTDNGSCYRSGAFKAALGEEIKHKRTRPRRPQANGKVERFNHTLMSEWAYARPYTRESSRAASYEDFLHYCSQHRTHSPLGDAVPSARVHNLMGSYN